MPRSLEQLSDDLEPTLASRDDAAVAALFGELIKHADTHPEDVEAMLGWGVLAATESQLPCTGRFGTWFMNEFPESVLPVKMEYAQFLAERGEFDDATQLAREYLRLVTDSGHIDNLDEFTNVRVGASKAFLLLTAAYTEVGARSYSRRVLEHAARYPLLESYLDRYQDDLQRLDEELSDPKNRRLDITWEQFFEDGSHANTLYRFCNERGCPLLARRVDLLEGHFRFRSDYRVDENELLQLVLDVAAGADAKPAQMLA